MDGIFNWLQVAAIVDFDPVREVSFRHPAKLQGDVLDDAVQNLNRLSGRRGQGARFIRIADLWNRRMKIAAGKLLHPPRDLFNRFGYGFCNFDHQEHAEKQQQQAGAGHNPQCKEPVLHILSVHGIEVNLINSRADIPVVGSKFFRIGSFFVNALRSRLGKVEIAETPAAFCSRGDQHLNVIISL